MDFPEGILEIGDRCFENCVSLEKVNISEGLERIGKDTFKNSKLKKVKLPESVVTIGYGAFNNCKELEYINLPHRIESIAAYNFENTLYLKNMKTDEFGCKYADNILLDAVDNGVKKIKIKDGTRVIAGETFANNKDIEEIFIPKSVEIILSQAFVDCSNLKKVTFEDGIKIEEIYGFTFVGCEKLENIELPKSLKSIYAYAFGGCAFKSIKIPENVEKLDPFAIRECFLLEEIQLPERLKGEYYWIETAGIKTPKLVFY